MTLNTDAGDPIQPAGTFSKWRNDSAEANTLPIGLELVRTTPTFTETTVPAALLAAHKTAKGVWGRLLVHSGELNFTFEDQLDQVHHLTTGGHVDIAPQRPHHLTVGGPSTFAVEFYRLAPEASQPD